MKKNYQVVCLLTVCALFLFYKYIIHLFPSLISETLIQQYQLSGVQLGILASSYYYSYTIMQLFSGVILDKYSIRYAAFFAILISAVSVLFFMRINNFYLLCVSRTLMGVGCAFATVLYLKCAAFCVSDRTFGLVSSFVATAAMLGAAMGSAPVAILFEKTGWQQGLFYIAVAGIFLSFLALLFISFGRQEVETSSSIGIAHIKKVVFNKSNMILLLYSGITFSPIIIMGGLWGIPFLKAKFIVTASSAATLMTVMFLGHAVGSPLWALINIKVKDRKMLMHGANLISFLCLNLILFAPLNFSEALFLFFCWGFAVGCFMLSFEFCKEINGAILMGIAVSFINSGEGLVTMILEPGIGYLLDVLRESGARGFSLLNYQLSLIALPVCYLVSSLLVSQLPQHQEKLTRKNKPILMT